MSVDAPPNAAVLTFPGFFLPAPSFLSPAASAATTAASRRSTASGARRAAGRCRRRCDLRSQRAADSAAETAEVAHIAAVIPADAACRLGGGCCTDSGSELLRPRIFDFERDCVRQQ